MSWPPERAIPALYPDCPPEIARWAADRLRIQTLAPHTEFCPLETWPKVPSSYLLGRRDGAVGAEWARRTARARLGVTADEIDSGHSPFLSRPKELAGLLSPTPPWNGTTPPDRTRLADPTGGGGVGPGATPRLPHAVGLTHHSRASARPDLEDS